MAKGNGGSRKAKELTTDVAKADHARAVRRQMNENFRRALHLLYTFGLATDSERNRIKRRIIKEYGALG